jgi:nucleotide-binding universal stress UspA family protein
MRTIRRTGSSSTATVRPSRGGPIVLVTLDVPFAPGAASFAVETAVESGSPLVVLNVAEIQMLPVSTLLGYEYIGTPEVDAALREPAELAHSLGVEVERLRVCSPHPVAALVEVIGERDPGLIVFGPDPARLRRRLYRRAAKAVRDRATCLVWLAD